MNRTIVLDAGPLGLLLQRKGLEIADACRIWVAGHLTQGTPVIVPEIADYEVRRELLRLDNSGALARLDAFNAASPDRYLSLNTAAMRRAAELWADTRQRGLPTADPKELDGDVILAAQVITGGLAGEVAVATTNPVHLSRFVSATLWQHI